MGILDGIFGNASKMNMEELEDKLEKIIIDGEKIKAGYTILRDYFVFTDKRLILVNKQGVTGKKVEYHSIPYNNIRQFSTESAGTFDKDSELKLWIAGLNEPVVKQFGKKSSDIFEVQKMLAKHILD